MNALGQTLQHEDLARQRALPFSPNQKLFARVEQGLNPNTNYALSLRSSYRRSANLAPDVTRVVNTSCQTLPQPPGMRSPQRSGASSGATGVRFRSFRQRRSR